MPQLWATSMRLKAERPSILELSSTQPVLQQYRHLFADSFLRIHLYLFDKVTQDFRA